MDINSMEVCKYLGGRIENGKCVIDGKDFKFSKDTEYDLYGFVVVTDWYGNKGYVKLHIETDDKGFREIKENPLQDYISFGVKSVDYAEFDVSKDIRYLKKMGVNDKALINVAVRKREDKIVAGDRNALKTDLINKIESDVNLIDIRY